MNQIGTVTETLDTIELGRQVRLYDRYLSSFGRDGRHDHRGSGSGGRRADQDRQRSRADRTAKYNQFLRIEEELGLGRALPRA